MTIKSYAEAEERFQTIKSEINRDQWTDPTYIVNLANTLPKEDCWLAFRLAQRAHNLAPDNKEVKGLVLKYKLQAKKLDKKNLKDVANVLVEKLTPKKSQQENKIDILEKVRESIYRNTFIYLVLLPVFLFFFYSQFIATELYESRSRLVIKQPDGMSTLSPEMALLGSFSGGVESNDAQLLKAYIYSNDLLQILQDKFDLRSLYSSESLDFFSRLPEDSSLEDFLEYYQQQVEVDIELDSGIINLYVKSNDPEFALLLNRTVLQESEDYINQIGFELAEAQLTFVNREHELSVQKLTKAQQQLLEFQNAHGLLDPESEGVAMQSITYALESKIAEKKAEISSLKTFMAADSSEVIQAENLLSGLKSQLEEERQRLAETGQANSGLSVSEVLVKFSELKVNVEMALQSYSASLVSLEKSRVEAYRQLKYLVTVESPTTPDSTLYPNVTYNVTLFSVVLLLLYGIGRIVIATILELK